MQPNRAFIAASSKQRANMLFHGDQNNFFLCVFLPSLDAKHPVMLLKPTALIVCYSLLPFGLLQKQTVDAVLFFVQ